MVVHQFLPYDFAFSSLSFFLFLCFCYDFVVPSPPLCSLYRSSLAIDLSFSSSGYYHCCCWPGPCLSKRKVWRPIIGMEHLSMVGNFFFVVAGFKSQTLNILCIVHTNRRLSMVGMYSNAGPLETHHNIIELKFILVLP